MRWSFGGHETFVIREGWLHKGLSLLLDDPDTLSGPGAADALGVGQNMAKSIRHWLVVTGLADRAGGKRGALHITELGTLIWSQDCYFLASGTWWALHMQLVNQPRAGAWCWFFNHFGQPRFERAVCIERLNQYLQLHRWRAPSRNTLERDISCLLRCYATTVPISWWSISGRPGALPAWLRFPTSSGSRRIIPKAAYAWSASPPISSATWTDS